MLLLLLLLLIDILAIYPTELNSVSHDAEDVNKVIETLIKHASKIFGDERYSALSRSFESNSLRLKPLTDIRDASTDAESAVSSEAHGEHAFVLFVYLFIQIKLTSENIHKTFIKSYFIKIT